MKFYISRSTSDDKRKPTPNSVFFTKDRYNDRTYILEINSLDELINLVNDTGNPVIISRSWKDKFRYHDNPPAEILPYELEIYDGYRE